MGSAKKSKRTYPVCRLIGDLTSVPQPIEIKLYSDDEATLHTLAPKVADTISKVKGVIEVKPGIIPAGDALNIQVDRIKVGLEGMDPDAVTKALDDFLTGNVTTKIQQGPKLIGAFGFRATRAKPCATSTIFFSARPTAISFPLSASPP